MKGERKSAHPTGAGQKAEAEGFEQAIGVDTYGGKVEVEWDSEAALTPLGQLVFFVQFLKAGKLFEGWVEDCPIVYRSPNAPTKRDVLGTLMLGVLTGQSRYAHLNALRLDRVTPKLLGMRRVMSEDSARRAFLKVEEEEAVLWQRRQLEKTYEPLLYEEYILDLDTSVKPLYGRQECAEIGYNPVKRGRPSHVLHTWFIANLRLVVDVEVQAGTRKAARYTQPGLWNWLDQQPRAAWPHLIRGDCDYGNESMLRACEQREVDYLFKLRMTKNVKALVDLVSRRSDWVAAGPGWEGIDSELKLQGWSRKRRVVVLRRRLSKPRKPAHGNCKRPPFLPFLEVVEEAHNYEYSVLVTSLPDEGLTVAQHYRDRADAENSFDELKNQWGLAGYTTQDLKRCQIMARLVAQVYNWWSIFVRLAVADKHLEGISSRPLLLFGIGRQRQHARQTTLKVTNPHAKQKQITLWLGRLSAFLTYISSRAEQLGERLIWQAMLSAAFRWFLGGRMLRSPPLIVS